MELAILVAVPGSVDRPCVIVVPCWPRAIRGSREPGALAQALVEFVKLQPFSHDSVPPLPLYSDSY